MLCDTCKYTDCTYKSKIATTKVLECSSKGCRYFSAFYAVVDVFGKVGSIEKHYQESKLFEVDGKIEHLDMKQAKGKKPVAIHIEDKVFQPKYLTAFYKLLWLKYLDNNPSLVEFAQQFNDYNDMFKGHSINCQADVIRQYCKDGKRSIIQECMQFIKILNEANASNKNRVFRCIIAGGRKFNDYELLKKNMDNILSKKSKEFKIIIVSGHAPGADDYGEKYADERGYEKDIHSANWNDLEAIPCKIGTRNDGSQYNILAGLNRNTEMAEVANACVVFWDGKSTGSSNMIETAKKYNLMLRVIKY